MHTAPANEASYCRCVSGGKAIPGRVRLSIVIRPIRANSNSVGQC